MAKFGNYEILDEFHHAKHGSTHRARRVGTTRAEFVIKRFSVPIEDPSEPRWEQQIFLDRTRLQQAVVSEGGRHWAPIHAFGLAEDDAYYVTDYYPVSAQRLIEKRLSIKRPALHSLVLGVVQGLSELKALRGRAHGNLKPGNVLLGGEDPTQAAIFLADLASNTQAARSGETGDLRALGELVHQLILHRGWDGLPLPAKAEWKALGSRGESWRLLCEDLLNASPASRLSLPIVANRLGAMRPRGRMRLRRVFATAAVLALAAGGAVGAMSFLDHTARARFCQTRREWAGKFLERAADPSVRNRWNRDEDLHRMFSQAGVADLRRIDCDSGRLIRWKYYEYKDVRDANLQIATLATELPAHWQKANRADELRRRFRDRGWAQPADYLAQLVDGATPGRSSDVAAGIDRLLLASPNVESGLLLADSDWKRFSERLQSIQLMHDPVLTALAGVLRKSAVSAVRLTDAGFMGLDLVKENAALAEQLSEAVSTTWPTNVDRDGYDRDVKIIDVNKATRADVRRWLDIVAANAYRRDEATAAAADLRKRLTETVAVVNRGHVGGDEEGAFDTARNDAMLAITEFEHVPFTRRTLEDGTFTRKRDEVRNRIEGIHRFYHPEGPEEWLNALPTVATASKHINAYWEAWRKVLRKGLPDMLADHNILAARQQASEQLRSLLVSLDQGFPPAPPIPNPAYMAAARLHREQALEKLLPLIDLRAPRLDADALKAAEEAFVDWTTNLLALSRDFPLTREILGPDERPDRRWKTKKPEFWKDPAVQALVKEDAARLARLEALETASRDELVTALNGSSEAEIALGAWRILGNERIQPPWPTQPDELAAESKFRQRLGASLKSLKDPAEAEGPTCELAEQASLRWARCVESATSEAMLLNALKLRGSFGVDERLMGKVAPPARYNLHLAQLHEAIAAKDDGAVREALTGIFSTAVALKDRPELADLPARIARLGVKEPFSDQSPGDLFTLALPGAARPVEFKRIEAPPTRPFYLCTTAVSVGEFAGVMGAAHAWPQAHQLAWPYDPGRPDTRRGPRAWEWSGVPATPMVASSLWFTPDEYNDFPNAFRSSKFNCMVLTETVGGNPSAEHPIQYISGQVAMLYAGLCGCRLPTPAEWQAAYALYGKQVPLRNWNLRDQTWETQRRYVADGGGSRWPDEGIFTIHPSSGGVGQTAGSGLQNDGALFFLPVNSGGSGGMFHHLVGNVAEFVCDNPEPFDGSVEQKTADSVHKLLARSPKMLFVIGGSALSPPDTAVDKPLPVARPQDAYADVGLRLAFTAPARTLAEKVTWAIGQPAYLWPKAEAHTFK